MGMPRRVFTYPGGIGWDWPNLVSTCGAFVVAAGFAVFVWDLLRPKGEDERTPRNPWGGGTLEWSHDVPEDPGWGTRSIPYITSRYPLWQQPKLVERIDAGRFYLPDAEEGLRETLVTTVLDAKPIQCLRVAGPTWITHLAALATGGAFIFPTFHIYPPAIVCAALAVAIVIWWLWTSTARVPEKPEKDVGLGLTLPIYASGPASVGWWAMWITMLADATAFASLIFGFAYLLDVEHRLPAGRRRARRPRLARGRRGPAGRLVGADARRPRGQPCGAALPPRAPRWPRRRSWQSPAARRCCGRPGSPASTRRRMSIRRSSGPSWSGRPCMSAPASSCSSTASPAACSAS